MFRLYLDEDAMDQDLVQALRARGMEVITPLEVGMIEQPDIKHLERAANEGQVLYSFNVGDFQRLHTTYLQEGKSHAGIVVARQQRYTVGEQLRRLLRLAAAISGEDTKNRLEHLGSWG